VFDGALAQRDALVQFARLPRAGGVVHAVEGGADERLVGKPHLARGLSGERIVDDESARVAAAHG
jgi:hypothetical protein